MALTNTTGVAKEVPDQNRPNISISQSSALGADDKHEALILYSPVSCFTGSWRLGQRLQRSSSLTIASVASLVAPYTSGCGY